MASSGSTGLIMQSANAIGQCHRVAEWHAKLPAIKETFAPIIARRAAEEEATIDLHRRLCRDSSRDSPRSLIFLNCEFDVQYSGTIEIVTTFSQYECKTERNEETTNQHNKK